MDELSPALQGRIASGERLTARRARPGDPRPSAGEPDAGCYLVTDSRSQTAAVVPCAPNGHALTQAGHWSLAVERCGHGWAIIARRLSDATEVATARLRWQPNAYKLALASDAVYQLTKNPFSTNWTLRAHRARVARFEVHRPERYVVEIAETPLTARADLVLVIVLALYTVIIDSTIPDASGSGPAP